MQIIVDSKLLLTIYQLISRKLHCARPRRLTETEKDVLSTFRQQLESYLLASGVGDFELGRRRKKVPQHILTPAEDTQVKRA